MSSVVKNLSDPQMTFVNVQKKGETCNEIMEKCWRDHLQYHISNEKILMVNETSYREFLNKYKLHRCVKS